LSFGMLRLTSPALVDTTRAGDHCTRLCGILSAHKVRQRWAEDSSDSIRS
jgi:hypothetical protein